MDNLSGSSDWVVEEGHTTAKLKVEQEAKTSKVPEIKSKPKKQVKTKLTSVNDDFKLVTKYINDSELIMENNYKKFPNKNLSEMLLYITHFKSSYNSFKQDLIDTEIKNKKVKK